MNKKYNPIYRYKRYKQMKIWKEEWLDIPYFQLLEVLEYVRQRLRPDNYVFYEDKYTRKVDVYDLTKWHKNCAKLPFLREYRIAYCDKWLLENFKGVENTMIRRDWYERWREDNQM